MSSLLNRLRLHQMPRQRDLKANCNLIRLSSQRDDSKQFGMLRIGHSLGTCCCGVGMDAITTGVCNETAI